MPTISPEEVFSKQAPSIHGLTALGVRMMKLDKDKQVTIAHWEGLFTSAMDQDLEFHKTSKAAKLRDFCIRLAKTSPKHAFDHNLWKDNRLTNASVTSPWKAAYNILGAKWAEGKFSTFEEYFNEYEKQVNPPKSDVYLHLPLRQPQVRNAMFNMFNRKHITFVKFKTPQFDGDTRLQREKEFIEAITEMLQTLWEMDPSILLIPWEANSKPKVIKKNTTRLPNTSDGWRLYTDRVFLKTGSRCWPRLQLAHDLDPEFLNNDELVETFKNNDTFLQKEAIQVYQSSKVGWFSGSHYLAFNTEVMKKSLETQKGLENIPIHLKTEYIKTDLRIPGTVKAVHIYTEYDKAYKCRSALAKLYAAGNKMNFPLGKNIQFIPDTTDLQFITTQKTKDQIIKCIGKQKIFIDSTRTAKNYSIIGLDNYIPVIGITMRQAIMGLRSSSQEDRNLFLAVNKQTTTNTVVFEFHKDLESEANTAISALPLILEWNYDAVIWKWFTDEACVTLEGFKYVPNEGIVESVQHVNMEWNLVPDAPDDNIQEVYIEGTNNFRIDTEKKRRSELCDRGSTVGLWGLAVRKRKINDGSVSSSVTSASMSVIDQFDHLLMTDPNFRASVLQKTAEMHQNTGPAKASANDTNFAMDTSGGEGKG